MDYKALVHDIVYSVVEGENSSWVERGFFVVELSCKGVSAAGVDEIEVAVDCDGGEDGLAGVGIDDCVVLSREVAERLRQVLPKTVGPAGEEEDADFALSVMSAGLGQPMKLGRQYQKLIRRAFAKDALPLVDVLFKDGRKLSGVVLAGIGYNNDTEEDLPSAIEVMYEAKELIPDHPKRKYHMVEKREQIALADAKAVTEHFDFK